VKIIKDKTHTYPRRLWFEDGEIEKIAEKHRRDSASEAGKTDGPALDMDKFIEIYLPKALNTEVVLDPYADLRNSEGPEVLGATHFHPDHLEIKIERTLTEEAERTDQWGRYNATGAHEGGHCILHRIIFERDPNQQTLFREPEKNKISCLKRTIEGMYTGEWWEFQANQLMANLLMPRELFLAHFEMERNAYGIRDNRDLVKDQHLFKAVVGYLARVFQVSKLAVKIRLREFGQLPSRQQESFLDDRGLVNKGGD
jgi:hypothetical protein